MFKKVLLASTLTAIALNVQAIPSSIPTGWSNQQITMGTAVTGENNFIESDATNTNDLKHRPVGSIFTYSGNNGAGDRGTIILTPQKTINILNDTLNFEKTTGNKLNPVFVFYSVDGSDGVWAMQQDLDIGTGSTTNLEDHYINLIRFLQTLESYYQQNQLRSTILLNPDFLGELHLQCQANYCPIPIAPGKVQAVAIYKALPAAIDYLKQQGYITKTINIPTNFTQTNTTIVDYIGSINWLVKTFAPDIPFAWQDNVWAGDSSGHLWLHKARTDQSVLTNHINDETQFLKQMLFDNTYQAYWPDFLAFDKWERDIFDSSLAGAGVNNGYMYNATDWDVYMQYVSGISKNFNNIPLMLWQIPGGHLQTTNDVDQRDNHGSTAPDYFFGDQTLQTNFSNIQKYISDYTIKTPSVYNVTFNNVLNYLSMCNTDICTNGETSYNWHTSHMQQAKDDNVFAILWGGGSTTGVIGVNSSLDDNGWLYSKIQAYKANLKNKK